MRLSLDNRERAGARRVVILCPPLSSPFGNNIISQFQKTFSLSPFDTRGTSSSNKLSLSHPKKPVILIASNLHAFPLPPTCLSGSALTEIGFAFCSALICRRGKREPKRVVSYTFMDGSPTEGKVGHARPTIFLPI